MGRRQRRRRGRRRSTVEPAKTRIELAEPTRAEARTIVVSFGSYFAVFAPTIALMPSRLLIALPMFVAAVLAVGNALLYGYQPIFLRTIDAVRDRRARERLKRWGRNSWTYRRLTGPVYLWRVIRATGWPSGPVAVGLVALLAVDLVVMAAVVVPHR